MKKLVYQVEFKKDFKSIGSHNFSTPVEITSEDFKQVCPKEFDEAFIDYEDDFESELLSFEEIKNV